VQEPRPAWLGAHSLLQRKGPTKWAIR